MKPVTYDTRAFNLLIDLLLVKFIFIRFLITPIILSFYPLLYSKSNIYYLINAIILFLYYFITEATTGRTFGKIITHTKVANVNGAKPTLYEVFLRTMWRFIPLEPLSFIAGKGWHDSQSKTIVIPQGVIYNLSNIPINDRLKNIEINKNDLFIKLKGNKLKATKIFTAKNILIGIGLIVAIFIITNPSMKEFKEFEGNPPYSSLQKQYNFFVCSQYRCDGDGEYIGILGNFFKI